MRTLAGLDIRFLRWVTGTVVLSGAVTLAATMLYQFVNGGVSPSGPSEAIIVLLLMLGFASAVTIVGAVVPAAVVWAIYWHLGQIARVQVRARAVMCAFVSVFLFCVLMGLLATTPALLRPFGPPVGMLMIFTVFGAPAALIVGPVLAAIIYRGPS